MKLSGFPAPGIRQPITIISPIFERCHPHDSGPRPSGNRYPATYFRPNPSSGVVNFAKLAPGIPAPGNLFR
ncbi:MAG: hypothetical protein WA874_05445, partial [Chryseosolibacter sp.]